MPNPSVLACVDRSAYANSVCDHASWLAGRMRAEIVLLNVRGGRERPSSLLEHARQQLLEEGAEAVRCVEREGRFAPIALEEAAGADIVVAGKRGVNSAHDRATIGSNLHALLRQMQRPVCLVSKVFLPISRALILLDADPEHRRTVETVASHPALRDLDMDLVVMSDGAADPEPKLAWARSALNALDTAVFPMNADGPDATAALYMRDRGSDLLIMSREVVLPDLERRLNRMAEQSVWAWRTPLLIC